MLYGYTSNADEDRADWIYARMERLLNDPETVHDILTTSIADRPRNDEQLIPELLKDVLSLHTTRLDQLMNSEVLVRLYEKAKDLTDQVEECALERAETEFEEESAHWGK